MNATAFVRFVLATDGVRLGTERLDDSQTVSIIRTPDSLESFWLPSDEAKTWLAWKFFQHTNRVASTQLLADTMRTLAAIALYRGSEAA